MGMNDRVEPKRPRDKSRGSVDNAKRLAGLAKRRTGADWGGADAKWILALVVAAQECGGAIRYGLSRDGGAYAVGVYVEGDSTTLYCNGGDELEPFLREIYDYLKQMSEAAGTSKGG